MPKSSLSVPKYLSQVVTKAAVSFLLISCANDRPVTESLESPSRVVLTPVAVTRLQESDSAYIGSPVSFAVSARNEFFVVDKLSARVLRYASTGQFQGAFGRYGHGPSEFAQPTFIEFVDDSTVLISDPVRLDFTLWNVDSSSLRNRVQYRGEMGFFAAERGAITGTVFNRLTGTIAARWRHPEAQPRLLGTLPAAFAPTNRFASMYGFIPFASFHDSVAYMTGESDYLWIADSLWNVTDSILVPRKHRRGVPETIDTTLGKGRTIYDVMSQLSNPYAMRRLSGSRFAVLHVDFTVRNNQPIGSVFLTIVDQHSGARCIDLPLPVHDPNTIARVAFRGDTLFILDQYVVGERAVVDIQRFTLSADLC